MRVLVAGGTGTIGRPVVSALVRDGHEVTGLARTDAAAAVLASLGAASVRADVLDADATERVVTSARPDVVVEQLSALPKTYTPEAMRATLAATGAVRTIGGGNVQRAAAAGAGRYVAQSGCYYYRPGPGLAAEDEPWVTDGPALVAGGVDAMTELERRVLAEPGGMRGIVLRYGFFYGPTTWWARDGDVAAQVRGGSYPIVEPGTGVWSFVHIDDAVAATVAAVTSDSRGAFNINDDDPLPINAWLPAYAKWVDAPPPPRVPAGPGTDPDAHFYANQLRGADNSRAKRELGFSPRRLEWLDAAEPGTAD